MPLDYRSVHVPLVAGVDTKAHEFALELPSLAVCENASFTEPGSIQKREGTVSLGTSILNLGGSLSNIKGLATRDDELVCFANGKVYTWSDFHSKWNYKSEYEGVEVTQKTVVQKPTDQYLADRCRYTSGSTIIDTYVWYDTETTTVQYQFYDGVTGAALSTATSAGANSAVPRCLVVDTKIHIYYHDTSAALIKCLVYDPTTLTTGAAVSVTTTLDANAGYDVCKRGSTQALIVANENGGKYEINILSSAGAIVTTATSAGDAMASASVLLLAVAYEPNLDRIAVIRVAAAAASIRGDILNGTTLADVAVDNNLHNAPGSTPSKFTACFRETAEGSGRYRCVVFYQMTQTVTSISAACVKSRYMETDGTTVGTTSGPSGSTNWLVYGQVASRAFTRGAYTYFTALVSPRDSALLHTYIVYREDGLIIARLTPWQGPTSVGGNQLPQVESLGSDKFACAYIYRTRVGTVRQDLYADKGIKDTILDFGSAKPYRGVQLGKSLYMCGGYLAQYDGDGVTESNFLAPTGGISSSVANGTGSMAGNSTYSYRFYLEWRTAQGELERSTYIETEDVALGATDDTATLIVPTVPYTTKDGTRRTDLVLAGYRTEANPGEGAPYYRFTSLDPTATGNNGYYVNDPSAASVSLVDGMTDATLITKELDYLNEDSNGLTELDNLAPDVASVIAQGQNRLFIAGGEDGNLIRYSKVWQTDDAVAFNDSLTIYVPREGGKIVALHATDNGLIVFKEHRIYAVSGTGPDNRGTGAYSEAQLITSDTGCEDARTVVQTPRGIMFNSPKGWRLLTTSLQLEDIGAPVIDYDSQTFVAALLLPTKNVVVCVTSSGKSLAYFYDVGQWSTWTQPVGIAAVTWNGLMVYAASTSSIVKSTTAKTDLTAAYTFNLVTPWIKLAGLQGFQRIRMFEILGDYVAAHKLRVKVAYNWDDSSWVDTQLWAVDTTRYQVRVRPSRQKDSALKIYIADETDGLVTLADSAKLVALSLDVGFKRGLARRPVASSI